MDKSTGALRLENVSKSYGDTVALDDLSFEVRPGEMFGFVGSNGAGKTTAMRIALGLLSADAGAAYLGDRPIDLEVRRRIGYMPEERGLYPKMTVGAQLVFLARLHGLSDSEATDAVTRWTERLGIGERVEDKVEALSLGNQQRVQLAAALVHDPDVLVLDEPFSGLDPIAVDVMSDVLLEARDAGVPIVFSSHQLELVERLCDRVGIVARGRMQAIGTVDELIARGGTRLVVHAPEAPEGWADGLVGVRQLARQNGRTVLETSSGADDQAVLAAALRTGPVHELTVERPSLTELFREVVTR